MRQLFNFILTSLLMVTLSVCGKQAGTELVAEYVTEILGADIYEIVPEDPYTEADLAYYTNGRADQEQNDPNVRPAISEGVENIGEYNTIILGYPIWHGQRKAGRTWRVLPIFYKHETVRNAV